MIFVKLNEEASFKLGVKFQVVFKSLFKKLAGTNILYYSWLAMNYN